MRTVSLLPSATEVVAALGAERQLVGRSHRCNYPARITDRPNVTANRDETTDETDPAAIDAVVDDHRHGNGSYFRVNPSILADTDPELILTQHLCEVCAIPESMTVDALEQLDTAPELVSVAPTTIEGIIDSIERIGVALDRERSANTVIGTLTGRIERVQSNLPDGSNPPRIVCLEWTDPVRAHGLWIPDILDILGVDDPFGTPGEPGREIEWKAVCDYDPDVLVVSPCGRTLSQIEADMDHLVRRPGWESLTAVEQDRVFLLDGELSSRHGPRVIRALELIASVLYPAAFPEITPTTAEMRPALSAETSH